MYNLFKIAIRNLVRYRRRTILTASLIAIGVLFVLVFVSVSGSFKNMIIGQITGSMLGDMEIHRKGYVASIDNLPLTLMMNPQQVEKADEAIKKGEIVVPELLARGMKGNVGDMVVVIATNKDGSVNGKQLKVGGILESATGPGGRDGYVHLEDAIEILRMEEQEISEIAIKLYDFGKLNNAANRLDADLSNYVNKQGKSVFEVHTWETLSPFYNIARMIDMMTLFIKIMLIAIVLISIMNVMIMAVYERIREIGTIAAIGTLPGKILSMFVIEGLSLGVLGAVVGNVMGMVIVYILDLAKITFDFGRQTGLVLSPTLQASDILVVSVIVIIVAVLGSLQPALKASKMEPIVALRHV